MKHTDDPIPNQGMPEQEEPKSKTKLKREMHELQKLGMRLVNLPRSYLKNSGIPSDLLDAVLLMNTMRTHGARRRQMQRIGVLMREADQACIERVLEGFGQPRQNREPIGAELDELALTLIHGNNESIEDIIKKCPDADRTRLRQLLRKARDNSFQAGQTRAFNALKAYLAEITE